MQSNPHDDPAFEARLRAEMPALPRELRARVLQAALPARRARATSRRWALAAFACVLTQWLLVGVLDWQRQALLGADATRLAARPSPAPAVTALALPDSSTLAFSAGRRRLADLP